jgi:hypothetical protein
LDELGVDVELRNAAQGSTSQVVTAPCIEQLVGPNVDLLLWEVVMNDIANVEQSHTLSDGHNQICSEHPIRCFAADAWIREAIRYKPSGIGFIHLWDIGIHKHELNASDGNIPDRAWKATTAAMHHYASIYGSYFSINIIRMIALMKLFKYKREFLRDGHHPNDHGYRVTADLFNWALLQNWIDGIKTAGNGSSSNLIERFSTVIEGPTAVYPQKNVRAYCMMSFLP